MKKPYYAIQPAFTGGEISEDVASRVDLDKYQLALLQSENMVIRPYGTAVKRYGLGYLGTTKNNGNAIIRRFEYDSYLSYMLEIGEYYIRIWAEGEYLETELSTPYNVEILPYLRTVQSVDVMYFCSGVYPVYKLSRYSDHWTFTQVSWKLPPMADTNDTSTTLTPSAITGNITITASDSLFTSDHVGDYISFEQYVNGNAETLVISTSADYNVDKTSNAISCGSSWKIITHGTWTGTVWVQISYDNGSTWKDLRKYSSKDDYNPTETGTPEDNVQVRIKANVSSGSMRADLSTFPYKHIGYAKITARTSNTLVSAQVVKQLGSTEATLDWALSAWSETNGYPYTVTFFQDRLCFGGNDKFPQRVWMSVTGDYENFEVEKEGGTVTDDSAISVDLLSQSSYVIMHLLAHTDLIIMTEGNTWTISGSETVTPSNISPRNQESYGANWVSPIKVGNRIVYVQRRGRTVRDVGYTYDSDSYVGVDLTLLAKHLVRDITIIDGAYAAEPDSCIYYVTSDGKLLILTYVPDQKVFAWSHFKTDGKILSVCTVASSDSDVVLVVVERTINNQTKRYIEYFSWDTHSSNQMNHYMLDSFKVQTNINGSIISNLSHLEGKDVQVLADGYYYKGQTFKVSGGKITLPEEVDTAIVGLPYKMTLEQANFDIGNTELGTIQGRKKRVVSAVLRLKNSYGGSIGPDADHQNELIYDPNRLEVGQEVLYSGDKEATLAIGGFNDYGRTYLVQQEPYPFSVSAIIRKVELDV